MVRIMVKIMAKVMMRIMVKVMMRLMVKVMMRLMMLMKRLPSFRRSGNAVDASKFLHETMKYVTLCCSCYVYAIWFIINFLYDIGSTIAIDQIIVGNCR